MGRIYLLSCDSGLNILPATSGISMKSHGNFFCFPLARPLPHVTHYFTDAYGVHFAQSQHSGNLPRIQSNHWLILVLPYFSESIGRRHGMLCPVFPKTCPFQA